MPIHDWTKVDAGIFHDFHQTWSIYIKNALNGGLLPRGLNAFVEQRTPRKEPDVLTVDERIPERRNSPPTGGTLLMEPPVVA